MITTEELASEINSVYYILNQEYGRDYSDVTLKQSSSIPYLYEAMEGDLVFYNTVLYEVLSSNFLDLNDKLTIVRPGVVHNLENEIQLNPKSEEVFPQEVVEVTLRDYKLVKEFYDGIDRFDMWLVRRIKNLTNRCNNIIKNDITIDFYECFSKITSTDLRK